jgi:hypothetical protein
MKNGWMIEESERIEGAHRLWLVEQSGHAEAIGPFRLEDVRPFGCFQGHAVGTVKTRRDKSDSLGKMSK